MRKTITSWILYSFHFFPPNYHHIHDNPFFDKIRFIPIIIIRWLGMQPAIQISRGNRIDRYAISCFLNPN